MHFASLLSIPDKISSMKWKGGCEKGVDGEPPELIIVYYSAGADVNIHTTGHFPLSIWARLCIRPANGVCGSGRALFVRNWGYFTIWKLAATLLCPNLQVTQRIYSAMQISGEEIWGSVQQVCSEAEFEAKNISFRCFRCSFIYQIGHTEVAPGWCKLSPWKLPYIEAVLTYSKPALKTNWCCKSTNANSYLFYISLEYFSPPYQR